VREGIGKKKKLHVPFSGSMVIGRERGELAAIEDGCLAAYMFFI
jgi:hypothetical protein